jgi:hypothetical protein
MFSKFSFFRNFQLTELSQPCRIFFEQRQIDCHSYYGDWILDPGSGDFILAWAFTSGAGKFDVATGTGHTYGNANLATSEAVFEFSGEVKVPE